MALAVSRAAAAPTTFANDVEREVDDCEADEDRGVLPGDEADDEDNELDDDRCKRRVDEGAFDYLDELDLERRTVAEAIARDREGARQLRELEAAVIEELAMHDLEGNALSAGSEELEELDELEPGGSATRAAFALEAEDVATAYEPLLHDLDASLDFAETAAFDDPLVREAIETGSAFDSTSFADPSELADLELRHQRPSRWGRLDLTIAWRRAWTPPPVTISLGPLPHGPIAQSYDTADHVLVLATWSR